MTERPTLSRPVAVPQSRLSRLARLGGMASGVAGGMAVEGVRQIGRGARPELRDLLLTPANIGRVTDQLARMRGAAMKVGQLVSMDTGEMLPPELAQIMARLRAEADHMPPKQLKTVLTAAWGPDWVKRFRRFDVRPIAAASIGQVHRAQTRDGRDLALKVQYPGVRRSIDSDVTNVGALIKVSGLLPPGLDLAPLLDEARKQLHEETDYLREGAQLARFGALMAEAPDIRVPTLAEDFTT
ncbi:MAG: AarF/UbiB family protein, partial [Pseudomonadota bacterium]